MSWLRPRLSSGSSAAPKTIVRFSPQFKAFPQRPRGDLAGVHARYSCARRFIYLSSTLWYGCFVYNLQICLTNAHLLLSTSVHMAFFLVYACLMTRRS